MANEFRDVKELREPAIIQLYMTSTTPADAAFTTTPTNGAMVFCTTDHKIYVREGGSWVKTAALS